MKNQFTRKQESQLRKAFDRIMKVGTAHIVLCQSTKICENETLNVEWYKVEACSTFNPELYALEVCISKDARCKLDIIEA